MHMVQKKSFNYAYKKTIIELKKQQIYCKKSIFYKILTSTKIWFINILFQFNYFFLTFLVLINFFIIDLLFLD